MARTVVLDGPMGTELAARGVPTPLPLWSAAALDHAPDVVAAIHRDYAAAGATVHTANTFRTKRRQLGARWHELAQRAVVLARKAVPVGHRIAGSIAPVEDCYRPDLVPPEAVARAEHAELAVALADAGVDLLLCETFASPDEARWAVDAAVATGRPTWLALTAGPDATLLGPAALAGAAVEAHGCGAEAVLVNCVGLDHIDPYVEALAATGIPFGVYANAGAPDARVGWRSPPAASGVERYAEAARRWIALGAGIVGSCCGTGPAHIEAVARR